MSDQNLKKPDNEALRDAKTAIKEALQPLKKDGAPKLMNLIAERNKKSLLSEADQQFLADNKAKFQNTKQNEAFAQFLAENPDYPTDSYNVLL